MLQQTRVFFLIVSLIITGCLSAQWKMLVSPVVMVSRGEDAVLNCSFTHRRQQHYSGPITVEWSARQSQALPFFRCSVKNESMEGPGCSFPELKYSLEGDPRRGGLSLLIRETQLTDNGEYFCSVQLDGKSILKKKTELQVTAEPQILSLSVVQAPPGSDGAPRRLQCEVEGHPPPKVVWLSASRRLRDDQGQGSLSGPYRRLSSVPYLEGEELTCRAESELGGAERTYPPCDTLMIILSVCGGTVLLLLLFSAGVVVFCRRNRARAAAPPIYGNAEVVETRGLRASDSPADGEVETQVVYSCVTLSSSPTAPPAHFMSSAQQHKEPGVLYSPVNVQPRATYEKHFMIL